MSATLLADVSDQVVKFWSSIFLPEFVEKAKLPSLVNRQYEGEIKKSGDTVYITQWNTPTATRRQTGSNEDTFESQKFSAQRVALVANQVITASYEFNELVDLQSQVGEAQSAIRDGLRKSLEIEVNNYLYSLVAPSTSGPDHSIASVTDFNTAQLLHARKLASQSQWPEDERYILADPSYMNDILNTGVLTSSDYVGDDAPVLNGKVMRQRFGFWIAEDTSAGMRQLSPTLGAEDQALVFHPSFMHMAMAKEPVFEVSSLHSQKRHGYLISCKLIMGAVLGNEGDEKHIVFYNT